MKKIPKTLIYLSFFTILISANALYARTDSTKTPAKTLKAKQDSTQTSDKKNTKSMPQGIPIVVDVDNITTPPQLVHYVTPTYPSKAKKDGLEGTVVVKALIDTTGKVEKATVLKTTDKIFNNAAIQAVKQFKFTPAKKGKKKVKVYVKIPVEFKLEKKHSKTNLQDKK